MKSDVDLDVPMATFDLDDDSWIRLEVVEDDSAPTYEFVVRDRDHDRAEVRLDQKEAEVFASVVCAVVGWAPEAKVPEHPLVTILRDMPDTLEYLVRLCGGKPEDAKPLLEGKVTDHLRARARTFRYLELP